MRVRGVNESHLVKRLVRSSFVACFRLSDSRENEYNCVGKASGGLGRGEAPQVTSFGK